jgi:8-oxo-dGTP diphosphatase
MYIYKYPRPSLTVDAVVFLNEDDILKILLIKRKHPPYEDCWALPGGFVDMDESLEVAAKRELKEETGLGGIELTQLAAFGDVDRDPRGRTVSIVFYGETTINNSTVKGNDDAAEAEWFDINNLPDLAFDHAKIVKMAVEKINE